MATPADQRLLELCDKWLKSLELHIRYSSLDTDSYWKVQPWPEHQRPSRWIIDLAVQKAVALRSQVQERIKQGDTKFSDSLELMTFLANLIGSEHIERFIPLADPENEVDLKARLPELQPDPAPYAPPTAAAPSASPPAAPRRVEASETPRAGATPPSAVAAAAEASRAARAELKAAAPPRSAAREAAPPSDAGATATREMPRPPLRQKTPTEATATREMPEFVAPKRRSPPVGTQQVARTERRSAHAKTAPRPSAKQPAKLESSEDAAREQVIADAARLVQWGRKWYELAELIARMADRPPLPEVRRILKENKTAIERKAGGGR